MNPVIDEFKKYLIFLLTANNCNKQFNYKRGGTLTFLYRVGVSSTGMPIVDANADLGIS